MTDVDTRPPTAPPTPLDPYADFELPKRRRWPHVLLGLAVGVGGTILIQTTLDERDSGPTADAAVEVQLATAPVEVRDLIEEVEWVADLTYGDSVAITVPSDGTITATPTVGTILRRGDVVLEIDEEPVIALYGTVPNWRDLSKGDEGPDVRQLETNLVALGYDPDGDVTIDDEFTSRTEDMVERWQADLGLDETGEVTTADFVVVEGPVAVTSAPRVGDAARSGTEIATVSARAQTATVVGDVLGEVTAVAEVGAAVVDGTVLYVADGVSVVATTDPAILVADEADAPTAEEPETHAYLLVEPGLQVTARLIEPGEAISVSRPVLELSRQTLSVTVPVALDSVSDWTVEQEVLVELPDGTDAAAVVVEVGDVAESANPQADPTIDVIIEFAELVDDDLPASEVTVVVAGDAVYAAMVVPTRALVSLVEGGFAVEKVLDDGDTVLVAVETGTFDDGVVEVTSGQLEPGDELVVPQ